MYLNLVQLAESFGVSERIVEGWIRDEGLPHTADGGRVLFDRSQVARWAAARGLGAQAGFLAPDHPAFATGLRLEELLRTGGIWRDVPVSGVFEVFERVVAVLPGATPPVRRLVGQRLRAPGGVTVAPVGGGFALPHPTAPVSLGRGSGALALLLLRDGLPLDEPPADGVPVTRMLFFIAPSPRAHLDLLGRLSRLVACGPLRELLARGAPDDAIFRAVVEADAPAPRAPGSRS